ncbi:hypothetical protein AALA17_03950 [Lactobacillaceae bacterium 24-114]
MAKIVTFKAKEVLGQDFAVMDSNRNIQKLNKCMKNIYKVITKLDDSKNAILADYSEAIATEVINGTADLLKLSKEDTEKLQDMSYSEIFNFYSKAINDFTGMTVPSVQSMQENLLAATEPAKEEDPKQSSDE